MGQFALSQSVPRTEDPRLLRGQGKYVDDFVLPRMAHAVFVRSPHAHADVKSIDVRAAAQMPGVLAVLTGADWAAEGYGDFPIPMPRKRRDGSKLFQPPHPAISQGPVRFVGEPVAMVVAENIEAAKDAAERVAVDYAPLPVLIDPEKARDGTIKLHEGCPDNETFLFVDGDKAKVEAAFAKAAHVTRLKVKVNRVTANTMEPRAAMGDYDPREERYTMYAASQRPYGVRQGLAQSVFKVPENKVRVIAGDVGGSFGMKSGQYPEYLAVTWAAKKLGRPVKWNSERTEGHASDYHDRDQVTVAELALDKDGTFLGLRIASTVSVGAYLDPGGVISPSTHLGGFAGLYTTPAIYVEASAVFTNTAPIGPFRGAGRPETTYILERLIDTAAREMKLDRAEIRRRNLIPPSAMPFKTGLSFTYDCGEFERNMDDALAMGDVAGFEKRRAEAAKRGKLRGLGICNFVEQTANADGETVRLSFDSSGMLTVIAGSISHGQGHDTMYKIILSDRLGIDADDIRVTFGDTDAAPWGGGTFASRTAVLGSTAAANAALKIVEKGKRLAAHMLEASASDIEFATGPLGGAFQIKGTDRKVSLQEVARAAYDPGKLPAGFEPGLSETATYAPNIPTFPNGCHVCEVEIDPDTGRTEILKYSVVDDVGTVINKLTLEGQIHGGIGQAVGQALTEGIVYDENGQLLTGSFMDYGMPRADDMCRFDCANNPVPTKINHLGIKGAGEAGNVGGLGAIMNAVVDALSPLGVTHIDMPATPEKVWRAIHKK
jgi:aerobic carbon-monoxide dehydrogenase large subunit